ncbi:MAG: hypothetical protein KF862_07150 [Chitinophagaceae bacterium]|nr:hypothetical protein [Chitinophagaceae bacterium]
MTSLLLIATAAMLNAFMDRIENENFYESIFRNWNERFWYKRTSWKYAKKIFGWKADAWHIAKSLMIIFVLTAISTADYSTEIRFWINGLFETKIYGVALNLLLFGTTWNLTFNLFYNKLFKK